MASTSISTLSTFLLFFTLTFITTTAIPETEYHSMLGALRFRGYNLFANAISTTDLHYDVINGDNFTFFAPTDSALYALDMSLSASDYTIVLRFHCVPHRLSLTDLRLLLFGSNTVPTLVPGHEIHVVNPLTLRSPIMVEGVDISYPGLFYSEHVAIHGLEGVMDFRSLNHAINSASVASNLTEILDQNPMNVHREANAPETASEASDPVTEVESAASPDVSEAHRISVRGAQRFHQPETKLESITQPESKSESIVQPPPAKTKSDSVTQPHTETYSESVTQPREEHVSMRTRSELHTSKIHGVSLARKSVGDLDEELGQVDDDKMNDCSVAGNEEDDDGEDGEVVDVANVRRGEVYARELYTPGNMVCVHE